MQLGRRCRYCGRLAGLNPTDKYCHCQSATGLIPATEPAQDRRARNLREIAQNIADSTGATLAEVVQALRRALSPE